MSSSLNNLLILWSFCFGAVIASFLNVVIWRVPRGESIVRPPSHCPRCNTPIRWYQNIPILSWLCLRGRCAACHAPISPRYILVETLGGVLFAALWWHLGFWAPYFWIWISLMLVGSLIDYDHKLLPDFVTVGGMIWGLLLGVGLSLHEQNWWPIGITLAGLALGGGLFYLIRALGTWVFKREAMGMGDVLLMGAVGAISGPVAVIFVLIFSSLIGSVIGLAGKGFKSLGHFTEIPYGPFICLAHLLWIFCGPELIYWYLGLLK